MFQLLGGWPWLRATVALLIASALLIRRASRLSWWLWALLVASLSRDALRVLVLIPTRSAGLPLPILPVALDGALWLVGPVTLVGLVTAAMGRAPVRWLGVVWALCSSALAISYPTIRGASLAQVYLVAQLVAVVVSVASVAKWVWRRERPTLHHAIGLVAVAVSVAVLLSSAWRLGDPFLRWRVAQEMVMGEFMIMSALALRWRRQT